jgi:hypothetical protein
MEEIKIFENLLEADERWATFFRRGENDEPIPTSLKAEYEAVEKIQLNVSVPEDVQSQFNIARMLRIYAWLYYPLHQVAELKAFSTVEMALKSEFPTVKGLRNLLNTAIQAGRITDIGFSHIIPNDEDLTLYSRSLLDCLPALRNDLAHGSTMLHPDSIFTLSNCSEIINQLFPSDF